MSDPINHPPHYQHEGKHPSRVECIVLTERMPALLANAVKYLYRAGVKTPSPVADLRKAAWYLQRAGYAAPGIKLTWNGETKAVRAALVRWSKAPGATSIHARVRGAICDILTALDGKPHRLHLAIRAQLLRQTADQIEREEWRK